MTRLIADDSVAGNALFAPTDRCELDPAKRPDRTGNLGVATCRYRRSPPHRPRASPPHRPGPVRGHAAAGTTDAATPLKAGRLAQPGRPTGARPPTRNAPTTPVPSPARTIGSPTGWVLRSWRRSFGHANPARRRANWLSASGRPVGTERSAAQRRGEGPDTAWFDARGSGRGRTAVPQQLVAGNSVTGSVSARSV